MLSELSLCYCIVYHYNAAWCYEHFFWVSQLDRALILLGLALCLPSAYVRIFSVCGATFFTV